MVKRSSLDPLEEARARVKLRYSRAKPVKAGPPTLGKAAMRLTRKAIPSKGATLSKLRLNWESIVGEQLARLCRPEKLTPARGGRCLTLKVIPAAAGLVQHQSEMVRQRVSMSAGGNITAIKLIQSHFGASTKPTTPVPVPLSQKDLEALYESVKGIEDEKLRAAIVALGQAVLTAMPDEPGTDIVSEAPLPF